MPGAKNNDSADLLRGYGARHGFTFDNNLLLFYAYFKDFAMYGCYDKRNNKFRCCDASGGIVPGFEQEFDSAWALILNVKCIVNNNREEKPDTVLGRIFICDGISLHELKAAGYHSYWRGWSEQTVSLFPQDQQHAPQGVLPRPPARRGRLRNPTPLEQTTKPLNGQRSIGGAPILTRASHDIIVDEPRTHEDTQFLAAIPQQLSAGKPAGSYDIHGSYFRAPDRTLAPSGIDDDGGDALRGYGMRHGFTFDEKLLLFYACLPQFTMYGCYDTSRGAFRCCDPGGNIVPGFEEEFDTPFKVVRNVKRIVGRDPKAKGDSILDKAFICDGISLHALKRAGYHELWRSRFDPSDGGTSLFPCDQQHAPQAVLPRPPARRGQLRDPHPWELIANPNGRRSIGGAPIPTGIPYGMIVQEPHLDNDMQIPIAAPHAQPTEEFADEFIASSARPDSPQAPPAYLPPALTEDEKSAMASRLDMEPHHFVQFPIVNWVIDARRFPPASDFNDRLNPDGSITLSERMKKLEKDKSSNLLGRRREYAAWATANGTPIPQPIQAALQHTDLAPVASTDAHVVLNNTYSDDPILNHWIISPATVEWNFQMFVSYDVPPDYIQRTGAFFRNIYRTIRHDLILARSHPQDASKTFKTMHFMYSDVIFIKFGLMHDPLTALTSPLDPPTSRQRTSKKRSAGRSSRKQADNPVPLNLVFHWKEVVTRPCAEGSKFMKLLIYVITHICVELGLPLLVDACVLPTQEVCFYPFYSSSLSNIFHQILQNAFPSHVQYRPSTVRHAHYAQCMFMNIDSLNDARIHDYVQMKDKFISEQFMNADDDLKEMISLQEQVQQQKAEDEARQQAMAAINPSMIKKEKKNAPKETGIQYIIPPIRYYEGQDKQFHTIDRTKFYYDDYGHEYRQFVLDQIHAAYKQAHPEAFPKNPRKRALP